MDGDASMGVGLLLEGIVVQERDEAAGQPKPMGVARGGYWGDRPLGRPLFLYTPCFFPMSVYFKCILNQKLLLLT